MCQRQFQSFDSIVESVHLSFKCPVNLSLVFAEPGCHFLGLLQFGFSFVHEVVEFGLVGLEDGAECLHVLFAANKLFFQVRDLLVHQLFVGLEFRVSCDSLVHL